MLRNARGPFRGTWSALKRSSNSRWPGRNLLIVETMKEEDQHTISCGVCGVSFSMTRHLNPSISFSIRAAEHHYEEQRNIHAYQMHLFNRTPFRRCEIRRLPAIIDLLDPRPIATKVLQQVPPLAMRPGPAFCRNLERVKPGFPTANMGRWKIAVSPGRSELLYYWQGSRFMIVKCNGADEHKKENRKLHKRACKWHCLVLAVQQAAYSAMEVAVLWRDACHAKLGDHPLMPSQG